MRDTERFAWLRRLIEWQQNLKDPQEFLSTVKDDLFPEEVFVFTPKGDVLDFPQGATRDRFRLPDPFAGRAIIWRRARQRPHGAAALPAEIGRHRRGHHLREADAGQGLGEFRRSPRAPRAGSANGCAQQQAERSRELGISLLDRELEPLGAERSRNCAPRNASSRVLKEFSQRDVDSLLAAVGYGIITAAQLLAKLLTPDELKLYRGEKAASAAGVRRQRSARRKEARRRPSGNAVIVSGVGDMLVRFARCCNPLPGEAITGFITRGRGVTVHLAGCPHALVTDPQRRVPVVWKDGEETPRPIRLEVLCVDQPGLLAAMSKAIATAGVNISTAEVKTTGNDGRALSVFELSVTSARQLNKLMHSIAAIDGVMRVSRLGMGNSNGPRA